MGRIRPLKTKRDELAGDLAKVVPLRTPPGSLYAEGTLQRFQASLRELLLAENRVMARHYLRHLIERSPSPTTTSRWRREAWQR